MYIARQKRPDNELWYSIIAYNGHKYFLLGEMKMKSVPEEFRWMFPDNFKDTPVVTEDMVCGFINTMKKHIEKVNFLVSICDGTNSSNPKKS